MSKVWTIGIVGLGEGRSAISAALESPYFTLGAICDKNEALCRERCLEFGLDNGIYTLQYEEMLKDPRIEVIGIYTPDPFHGEHIRMALEAGKHVICTKPLLTSLEEAESLLELQKKSGRMVYVGQSSRYFEPMLRQRQDYEAGRHGELITLEVHYVGDSRWFLEKEWSLGGGFSWMYNFMIHAVDLAAWYLPEIEVVYGVGLASSNTRKYGLSVPDTMKFILKDKSGVCASVNGVYASPALGNTVEQSVSCTLRGTEGISRAGYPRLQYYTKFAKEPKEAVLQRFDELHDYYFRFEGESYHAGEDQNYMEDFARCMETGVVPKPDLKEGIRTLAVMEAMDESMRTGQIVTVSEVLKKRGKLYQFFAEK